MDIRKLRKLGEDDAVVGKPIEAFDDIPNIEHSEAAREQYGIGYRATEVGPLAELAREGH
jgi:hypothetical protein